MPFIMQQQLHIPPSSILHKFCKAPQATSSSHEQVIFIPPAHFSILIVARGNIDMLLIAGIGIVDAIAAGLPMGAVMARSIIIIALDILHTPLVGEWSAGVRYEATPLEFNKADSRPLEQRRAAGSSSEHASTETPTSRCRVGPHG
ncbi:MAG TPA: hypothetical protein VHZ24_12910 [Pirellulales bacterium]|nr:hypothetical protein [Pirellulales bacterium]